MSKNQPQAKSQFIQNFLLMMLILFGVQYFFFNKGGAGQTETRTVDQIIQTLRDDNKKVLDLTAARDFSVLQNKLKSEKISKDEKDAKELEGAVLVADTEVKGGFLHDDLRRFNNAYTLLQGYEQKFSNKPSWNNVVAIDQPEKGPIEGAANPTGQPNWTAAQLYGHTISVLDQKNKDTLVWGMFPGYQLIDFLVHATGATPGFSYWFAAVLLAVALRALLFPLSQKQMMYSRQMQQLMPLMKELKEKFKDDPMELQKRQMGLYQEYGLNPMAGCLPMLIQFPVIYLIYACMLHYRFEFQKGTFLWINPEVHAHIPWIAPNLGQKDLILLSIYAVSMITTSMMMPVADPTNMRQQRLMQIGMSALIAVTLFIYPALPSGFVLYWATTNVLTTLQVLLIYRKPLDPLVKVNTKDGGVYPKASSNGSSNGKMKVGLSPSDLKVGPTKTGTPAKHKPKKRK